MENQTQTEKILKYLLSGGKLTALDALKKFNCFRLASRVSEIRQRYKVKVETVKTKGGARIARYSISL